MNREQGPHYEMPEDFSFEKFNDKTLMYNNKKTQNKQVKKTAKKRKISTGSIIGSIITVMLLILVIVIQLKDKIAEMGEDFTLINKPISNVVTITEEDINVEFTGYEGAGNIVVSLKKGKIAPKIYKILEADSNLPGFAIDKEVEKVFDDYQLYIKYKNSEGDYEYLTTSDEAVNGQMFKIGLSKTDDKKTSSDDVVLKMEEITVQCSGLKDGRYVDVFEDIQIAYSGVDGNIKATCLYVGNEEGIYTHYFNIKGDDNNLSYGDNIEVYVDDEWIERFYSQFGIKLLKESCIFTVESKPEYVLEIDKITESNMQYMKDKGIEVINEWIKTQNKTVSCIDLQYFGAYLYSLSQYNSPEVGISNKCVMVYTALIHDGAIPDTADVYVSRVYIPIVFENIIDEMDGKQSVDENVIFRSNLHLDKETEIYLFGYEELSDMINSVTLYEHILSVDTTESLDIK